MRTTAKLGLPLLVISTIFVATGLAGQGSTATGRTRPPPASSIAAHPRLQTAADMTQAMSAPTASGAMQAGLVPDDQLLRSSDPAFVAALEQHQGDIDRMLARPAP